MGSDDAAWSRHGAGADAAMAAGAKEDGATAAGGKEDAATETKAHASARSAEGRLAGGAVGAAVEGDARVVTDSAHVFPDRPGRLRTTPLRGIAMGLADSVPGVSGGTVALILGIHPRLVRAIAAIDISIAAAMLAGKQKAKRAWQHADLGFLALLGLGIVAGILAGFVVLSHALERWPVALMALLLGIVAASIPVPARIPVWDLRDVALACATGFVAFLIGVVPGLLAPEALWFLPVAGAIAACAMILPGISGSYLLLLMGLYEPVVHAGSDTVRGLAAGGYPGHAIAVLLLVAVGALVGLLAFSRGLRHMLDRHPGPTHAAMVGLLAGSLVRLWPWRSEAGFAAGLPAAPDVVLPLAFLAIGVAIGWGLDRAGRALRR